MLQNKMIPLYLLQQLTLGLCDPIIRSRVKLARLFKKKNVILDYLAGLVRN